MKLLGLAAIVLVACAGPGHGGTGIPTGHAFEYGRGTPRDYRRATELYAGECRGGRGDLASCDSWFRLSDRLGVDTRQDDAAVIQTLCERGARFYCFVAVLRGVPPTGAIARRLAAAAQRCQAGDQTACTAVQASTDRDGEPDRLREVGVDVAATPALCAKGDAAACKIALATYGLVSVTVSHRSGREKVVEASACSAGLLDACAAIVDEALAGCYRVHTPRAGCLDALARRDGEASVAAPRRALQRLNTACDEGDLDACRHVPGRSVQFCALCAAGDAAACRGTIQTGGSCHEVDRDARHAMTGFQDRLCACHDAACGQAVTADLAAWSNALATVEPDPDPSPDAAIAAIAAQVAACQQKLLAPQSN
jgi:hypothetical protein